MCCSVSQCDVVCWSIKIFLHAKALLATYLNPCCTNKVQPIAFGVLFLKFQISIDYLVSYVSFSKFRWKDTLVRSRSENEMKWHSKCNRQYFSYANWCERCLLITESPKTPGHYRYLIWVLPMLIPVAVCCSVLVTHLVLTTNALLAFGYTNKAHGGDQTRHIWISRCVSFSDRSFKWRGLRLHKSKKLGIPVKTCLICMGNPVKTCWNFWQP